MLTANVFERERTDALGFVDLHVLDYELQKARAEAEEAEQRAENIRKQRGARSSKVQKRDGLSSLLTPVVSHSRGGARIARVKVPLLCRMLCGSRRGMFLDVFNKQ